MKRLLIFYLPILIPFLSYGDYRDYFSVGLNDSIVCGGDTIVITERIDYGDYCSYMPHFTISNETETEYLIFAAMIYTDNPTKDMIKSDPDFWGRPQFCMSSCFANGDDKIVGYGIEHLSDTLHCFPEITLCSNDATSTYRMKISACFGTPDNYVELNDSIFEITIIFKGNQPEGVEIIEDGNNLPEYFNLQGHRIQYPDDSHIYIERHGNNFSKKAYRKSRD